ncbi:mitochondrial ribosome-associated GTPase 1-like isoform X2 [Corticium candelabrum]|uniref:mitochondrial ribosome-associated GTPase 1-like isoform X2 n=1 Tax=Corticium candelabrum TaxID=121492 RepID=UPI002E26A48F|nr:mitochondrial ribosome-associated GTPase 1-like isoform X2 [Corticium candelabrum]
MTWMRTAFELPRKSALHWYPGHMAKGLRVMRAKVGACNCILEVHDARIPCSGRNKSLSGLVASKPHILILNKMDLAETEEREVVVKKFKNAGLNHVIYADCVGDYDHSHKEIMERVVWCLRNEPVLEKNFFRLMVIGVPNTGKSSLINALRRRYMQRGKATKVGSIPGVTRSVLTQVQIHDDPRVYMLDTPGVMLPDIQDIETGMKLAAVGALQDHVVGEHLIADFILYSLNKRNKFRYVDAFGLERPSDTIDDVLIDVAKRIGAFMKGGRLDTLRASQHFISRFRNGTLGRVILD